ncbi:MAG: hypothetical protein IJW67_10655, partial [Blautia sp.]|nr:hypothetical protein [Blautia sp.]
DEETIEEDIRWFLTQTEETADEEALLSLGLEYAGKYPDSDRVLHHVCWILMWLPEEKRKPHLSLLGEMCEKIMNISTVQTYRDAALEILCATCPDEQFEKWHSMCSEMYYTCAGEILEMRLSRQSRWDEVRIYSAVNRIFLTCHMLNKWPGFCSEPEYDRAWALWRIQMLESFGENGVVPEGWIGFYAVLLFNLAAFCFGCEDMEEGWQNLEKAFTYFDRWHAIPAGTALELGHFWFFRGVKALKNEWTLLLPDGTEEDSTYCHTFTDRREFLYNCLSNCRLHWKQFAPVWDDERFAAYVRRAKDMMEAE